MSGTSALITIDGGNRITLDGNRQFSVLQVDTGTQAVFTGLPRSFRPFTSLPGIPFNRSDFLRISSSYSQAQC